MTLLFTLNLYQAQLVMIILLSLAIVYLCVYILLLRRLANKKIEIYDKEIKRLLQSNFELIEYNKLLSKAIKHKQVLDEEEGSPKKKVEKEFDLDEILNQLDT